ncbi:MAG: capsule assembly Wzi family protein, partial [Tannerellaceae bacterium]|nr:capsule assembly Wzi family protein [Tannerellaceae bacterium]
SGLYAPFWLTANKHGFSSIRNGNGYVRMGIFREPDTNKTFSWGFALDGALARRFASTFVLQQACLDLNYGVFTLSMGSKERDMELKNQQLSTGGMTLSRNARPIPQLRMEVPRYWALPFAKGWLALRGHLAYGVFTDNNWQRSFARPDSKYTQDVLYHSKSLFIRIGNESKRPLVFEGGIEMASQFRGIVFNRLPEALDMRSGWMDFVKVLIPSGSDPTDGENPNVYGNHLGSWNFSLAYTFPDWKARVYYDHFFEDHSMLFFEYVWIDALVGLEITLPPNPVAESIVYEFIGTKDQAGPIYHDRTQGIYDQISARDNYYNHVLYASWQHAGMALGNPLLISPIYNTDGSILFHSNRILAHHIGLSGRPFAEVDYRLLLSHTRSWGTYSAPFEDIKRNTAFLLEIGFSPRLIPGWRFAASFASDRGDLIGHNTGGMITIGKKGVFTK